MILGVANHLAYENWQSSYFLRFPPTDAPDFTCLAGFLFIGAGDFTSLAGEREK